MRTPNVGLRYRSRLSLAVLVVLCNLLGSHHIASAQKIDPSLIREEDLQKYWDKKIAVTHYIPSPKKHAKYLLVDRDLVALGEFVSFAAPDPTELIPQIVTASFRVDESHKGSEPGKVVAVELQSDMLAATGERISRYEKRKKVMSDLAAERSEHEQRVSELDKALEAGSISAEGYRTRGQDLERSEREWLDQSRQLHARLVIVSHGGSFYDLGGVILLGEKYVLAVDRISTKTDTYLLEETTQGVFWSDTRDALVPALRTVGESGR